MIALIKRYKIFLLFLFAYLALLILAPGKGLKAIAITKDNTLEMLSFLPPIFVLLGLMDVWVNRETMMKYMGDNSGVRGSILAFILGSAAAGPLYAAFPVAGILIKKGARMLNVFIFIGAWSTTRIPLIVFETATLGFRFAGKAALLLKQSKERSALSRTASLSVTLAITGIALMRGRIKMQQSFK